MTTSSITKRINPVNILSLDGGGMRGLYTASLFETLSNRFAQNGETYDLGKGFDLIYGTSTGAIFASALANGVRIDEVKRLYRDRGRQIFPDPMPNYRRTDKIRRQLKFVKWCIRHRHSPGGSGDALKSALEEIFSDETFGSLYQRRGIALCLTATEMHQHHPCVFKTPHRSENRDRDNNVRISDACLASAAAPVYLPLSKLKYRPSGETHLFADGGLWANNPVTLAVIEGLQLAEKDQPIRILSVGTCPPTSGEIIKYQNRGLLDWKAGASALELSMNAQAHAANHHAELLIEQLQRRGTDIELYRVNETQLSTDMTNEIALDNANKAAGDSLIRHGKNDGDLAYREVQQGSKNGKILTAIFERIKHAHLNNQTNTTTTKI